MESSSVDLRLSKINELLAKIKVPISLLSLKECVPSLWIALFEGLLETRIPEIDRSFSLSDDSRTKNLVAVLSQLKRLFKIDVDHIIPQDLISYNEAAVCSLIDVFVEISESLHDWKSIQLQSQGSKTQESAQGEKKRKRSIYTGKKLQSIVNDDISRWIKDSNRSSLDMISVATPVKERTQELLRPEEKDTPHMKALKLKRMNLLKNISKTTENAVKSRKSQKIKVEKLNKMLESEMKQKSSRPSKGPLAGIEEIGEKVSVKEYKTRPERNLDIFEERVRKSIPTLETYPSNKVKDHVHEQQLKTWTKALDDRLWTKKVSDHSYWDAVSDTRVIEQAQKEIETTRNIDQRRKESNALRNIKADLNERVRRTIRMEHRLQVAHEDVENIKMKRRFREEQAVKGLLDDYVKAERQTIIEERRFEKDKKKAQEEKERLKQEAKLNYYKDQIEMLKEKYEETKREEEIMEKARKEEYRKIVREKKEEAKKKVKMVKEKLEVDASNLGFQEATAHRLRSSLKFAFR